MLPNGSNVSVFNLQTCFKLFHPTLGLRAPVVIIDVTVFRNNGFAKAKSCSMSPLLILAVVVFRELHTCYFSSVKVGEERRGVAQRPPSVGSCRLSS